MADCIGASTGVKRTSVAADSVVDGKKRTRYARDVPAGDHAVAGYDVGVCGDASTDGNAEDVREYNDEADSHFPLLEDMDGSGIRAFSSLDTETIYQILQFDKRTEEFRDEKKHNLILTLRGRGSRSAIDVRATGLVQKTLTEKYELESLFATHTFYIRYLGQKKSCQSGNMFCNFCIVTKEK